jgi:predicted metal-dependent hydrolase
MDSIKIVRSNRRSVGIQINHDASVTVSVPYLLPKFLINKFLQEKEDWIKQKQQLMVARIAEIKPDEYWYLGKTYKLVLGKTQKSLVEVSDKLYVGTNNSKFVKTYLESWYKQQARKIIIPRVQHYAKLAGATYRSISITTAETRWGSCSSEKTLNFNWKLVMAPVEVIDYVICHELAHLTELNHSHDFWETVRKMYPLYRQHRTWLKRYGNNLRV